VVAVVEGPEIRGDGAAGGGADQVETVWLVYAGETSAVVSCGQLPPLPPTFTCTVYGSDEVPLLRVMVTVYVPAVLKKCVGVASLEVFAAPELGSPKFQL
jgi:hypothetical protein